jgi:hypothetical protein
LVGARRAVRNTPIPEDSGRPGYSSGFCEDDGMDGEDPRLAYDMDASFML